MATSDIDDDLPSLAAGLSTEDDDYLYGIDPLLAAQHGLATNEHGGVYQRVRATILQQNCWSVHISCRNSKLVPYTVSLVFIYFYS